MYGNPYMNSYTNQPSIDRINMQISELERLKEQVQKPIQQPTNLTQNFQLASNNSNGIKYANSMEEVKKEMVMLDTPFFSKDMSILWLKGTNGNIRTFELNEIIAKDEKDIQIALLQAQINELKEGMNTNEQFVTNDISTETETNTAGNDESIGTTVKKSKSSSVSRVSTSKKK